jgi:hypothetical protein
VSGARAYFEVRFKASEKLWTVSLRNGGNGILAYLETRADAMKRGAQEAKSHFNNTGQRTELVIYRQDGAIGKGHTSRTSYPRRLDPRRSRG